MLTFNAAVGLTIVVVMAGVLVDDVQAQGPAPLRLRGPQGGGTDSLSLNHSRGFAAVSVEGLEALGWAVEPSESGLRATMSTGGSVVEFVFGIPLFRWNGEVLQLVDVPFEEGGVVHVPLQFILDFLPVRMGERYAFLADQGLFQVRDSVVWSRIRPDAVSGPEASSDSEDRQPAAEGRQPQSGGPGPSERSDPPRVSVPGQSQVPPDGSSEEVPPAVSSEDGPVKRVVIIDPGHGGRDPGTSGSGGRREKDIALAVGRALARELAGDETLEVFVTRDRDVLIPIWERGELATAWKGDRPGIFVSIHANSSPNRGAVRGFETLFLSDARTEHERRVAANENAPLQIDREVAGVEEDSEDLGFILRELRNLDHAHWSSLLAEGIQRHLDAIHPGPNRGVKQAPLAVLTNALMPAVLVEVGFVTNRTEERLLSRGEFQGQLAEAMARAIRDFFERYPPGQGETVTGQRP